MTEEKAEMLKQINLEMVHFAFDRWQDKDIIEPKLRLFKEQTGYKRGKVSVFILTNYDTTLEQDLYRIQLCRELDFSPYVAVCDREHCAKVYKDLQRWANNSWVFWSCKTFEEYGKKK